MKHTLIYFKMKNYSGTFKTQEDANINSMVPMFFSI